MRRLYWFGGDMSPAFDRWTVQVSASQSVTTQENGIQQINYVTEPGPRLVGVTRRQAFQP